MNSTTKDWGGRKHALATGSLYCTKGSFILNKSTFVTPSALYRIQSDTQTELSRKKENSGKCELE